MDGYHHPKTFEDLYARDHLVLRSQISTLETMVKYLYCELHKLRSEISETDFGPEETRECAEQMQKKLDEIQKDSLDQFLKVVEDRDPDLAARIDTRRIDDVP